MPILGDFTVIDTERTVNNQSVPLDFGTGGVASQPALLTFMVRGLNKPARANIRITNSKISVQNDDPKIGEMIGIDNSEAWHTLQFAIKSNHLSGANSDSANTLHFGVARLQGSGNIVQYRVKDPTIFFHQQS